MRYCLRKLAGRSDKASVVVVPPKITTTPPASVIHITLGQMQKPRIPLIIFTLSNWKLWNTYTTRKIFTLKQKNKTKIVQIIVFLPVD